MYEVFLDDQYLYYPGDDEAIVINPKVHLALNDAGYAEMTVPLINPLYDAVQDRKSMLKVIRNGSEIFYGEVRENGKNNRKEKRIYAVGELSYLYDSVQPQKNYGKASPAVFLQGLLNWHNSVVEEKKQIFLGTVTITEEIPVQKTTNFEDTMSVIKSTLLDPLGGFLRLRRVAGVKYLDYIKLEEYGSICSQSISFGENLMDYSDTMTSQDIVTALIPLGDPVEREDDEEAGESSTDSDEPSFEQYTDISSVTGGNNYIYSAEAVEHFGWVWKKVSFDGVKDPAELLRKAELWLRDNQFETLVLTLTAVDLSQFDVSIDAMNLGDRIPTYAIPYGMDKLLPLQELELNLQQPDKDTVVVGDERKITYTHSTIRTGRRTMQEIRHVNKKVYETQQYVEQVEKTGSVNVTRLESKIEQTEESILLEVSRVEEKGDEDFETLASAISMTANEILLEVSENYATRASLALKLDEETKVATLSAEADVIALHGGQITIDSGNFQIDEDGNVSVKGAVEALSGKIGGWTITDDKIYAGTEYTAVMQLPSAGKYIFAAGGSSHDDYSDCPFRVTYTGKVYSKNLVVENAMYMYDEINKKTIKAIDANGGISFPNYCYFEDELRVNKDMHVNKDVHATGTINGKLIQENGESLSAQISANSSEIKKLWTEVNALKS